MYVRDLIMRLMHQDMDATVVIGDRDDAESQLDVKGVDESTEEADVVVIQADT